jgi:hypothetical protein
MSGISAWSGFRPAMLAVCHRQFSRDWHRCRSEKCKSLNRAEVPRDDTFCFLCICRTQVRNLSGFKLCQCGFSTEGPETYDRLANDTSKYYTVWYSESVVLNFVNVFTYSRVLLYTLQRERSRILEIETSTQYIRSIRRIFVSVLQKIFDLRYKKTTSVIEFCRCE